MARIDNEMKKERALAESVRKAKQDKVDAEESEIKSKREIEVAKQQLEAAKKVADENKELAAKTKAEITAKVEEKIDILEPSKKTDKIKTDTKNK